VTWFARLKALVTGWLHTPEGDDPFAELEAAGFQRVYLMGKDGQHYVASDLVGLWVEDHGRCLRFKASVYDPEAWPVLKNPLFGSTIRPGELIRQYVADPHQCWWSEDTLVLHPCSPAQLLERLVEAPGEWEVAARHLGVGTLQWWAR
jgi:hypothetical protein